MEISVLCAYYVIKNILNDFLKQKSNAQSIVTEIQAGWLIFYFFTQY